MAFDNLGEKLGSIFRKLSGQATLNEKNMDDALSEVRKALLEADVNYGVVNTFISDVKTEAIGQKVLQKVSPGDMVIKICHDKIVSLLGDGDNDISFRMDGKPTVIMLVGLQGTGKTTSAAKLAQLFQRKYKKKVLLAALDIYRPAAIDQLVNLGKKCTPEVPTYVSTSKELPPDIASSAYKKAVEEKYNILILDTAGRLEIDEKLMDELKNIQNKVNVDETLLTVDSMVGQNATNVALTFNTKIKLTGFIFTKFDGDSRGGAALSVKRLTNIPLKYVGVGEKIDDLENFYPDRMADRILGMGDIVSLVESIQEKVDQQAAEKTTRRIEQGLFDMNDMLSMMKQINKLGPLGSILRLVPGAPKIDQNQLSDAKKAMKKTESMILSMTKEERKHPEIIKNNRRNRIAKGSGNSEKDVANLLTGFENMKSQMKNFKNNPFLLRQLMKRH